MVGMVGRRSQAQVYLGRPPSWPFGRRPRRGADSEGGLDHHGGIKSRDRGVCPDVETARFARIQRMHQRTRFALRDSPGRESVREARGSRIRAAYTILLTFSPDSPL
jgi:hypothetical protein